MDICYRTVQWSSHKGLNIKRQDVATQLYDEAAKGIVLGKPPPVDVQFTGIRRHGLLEVGTRPLQNIHRNSFTKR